MLKSSLFILFCKTGVDFYQRETFILKLDVYSRQTTSFQDLTYSRRTLFCDTTDQNLLHFIMITLQNVVTLVRLGCKGNGWCSCFHMLIVMLLCFFNNMMQDMR